MDVLKKKKSLDHANNATPDFTAHSKKKRFTPVIEPSLQSEHFSLNAFRYYELKTNWRCSLSVGEKDGECTNVWVV